MSRALPRVSLPALLALAAGCSVDELRTPAPLPVLIDVRNPFGVDWPPRTGVAVVWTSTAGVWVGPQAMFSEPHTVRLDFEIPEEVVERKLAPLENLQLFGEHFPLYRPRIVVFEDRDGNGAYDPRIFEHEGGDPVLGIEGNGTDPIYALMQFERSLARMTLEQNQRYHELTGGRHSRIIAFEGRTSTLTPDALRLLGPPVVSIHLTDSDLPERDLECLERRRFDPVPELQPIVFTGTSSRTVVIWADRDIDPAVACGLTLDDCRSANLDTLAPELPRERLTDGRRVLAQCRQSQSYTTLVILEAHLACERCRCGWVERHTAYLTRTGTAATRPAWWPCGERVPFCDSGRPLYLADDVCALPRDEETSR